MLRCKALKVSLSQIIVEGRQRMLAVSAVWKNNLPDYPVQLRQKLQKNI